MHKFLASIEIIGINPFVYVPEQILKEISYKLVKIKATSLFL